MINRKFFGNIKFIVLIGYTILFILTIFGVAQIYRELVKLSNQQNPYENRRELTLISNALVSMYESEGVRKVMLSDNFDSASVNQLYNKLNTKVMLYIDSLHSSTTDKSLQLNIDTIKILFNEKDLNFRSMIVLLDSIKNLPYSEKILTTVLSRKDISNLNELIKERTETKTDTSFLKKEKKGFFERVKQVFIAQSDSTQIISKQNTNIKDSSYLAPITLINDTVIQYLNDISKKHDKRKIAYLNGIHLRQNDMLYYDELLSNQINSILLRLDIQQREIANLQLINKEETLKNSFNFMSVIALIALFTLIVFIIYTLYLINRGQEYRTQLEISKKHAEDLMKSRERLLLMISHDIKSPLSSIFGHIELLRQDQLTEDEKNYIASIKNASDHILGLVNKLLDYHILEQGRSEVNKLAFSPFGLMEDIYNSFIPLAQKKGLKLINENNINANDIFECDPFILKQIANNLISNAIKFTTKGSVYLSFRIDEKTNLLHFNVRDTGVGIKKEDKNKIFEEFRRAGSKQSQQVTEGYGLGLAITNKLIKLVGGKLVFESDYGKGTEFRVTIPLTIPSKPELTGTIDTIDVNSKKVAAKILFIDDDLVLLNVFKKLLQKDGSEVTTCDNPEKVIDLIRTINFDIIFTDIQMPNLNGFELVKKIRSLGLSHYEKLPIIALSGRMDISIENFKLAGFTSFLSKPTPYKELELAIIKHVTHKTDELIVTESEINKQSNLYSLIEYLDDDSDTAIDILNVFIAENKIKLVEFEESLQKRDWAAIKWTAHKLLPLMRMIEANEIVLILESIEDGSTNKEQVISLIKMVKIKNEEVQNFIDLKFKPLSENSILNN
jgi:signal transduction histidine kinase/CheY-like chemotaxis protein